MQKCSNEVQDFFHLFRMLGRKLSKEEMEKWATLSWAIWNARNKLYFEKIQTHPKVIMDGALATLETYQKMSTTQGVVGLIVSARSYITLYLYYWETGEFLGSSFCFGLFALVYFGKEVISYGPCFLIVYVTYIINQ